ncbi:conserved hypothetical protein [Culex quinquefasciatus]|uniref:Uncharacterized protein n=1 Tax=Culex quinquefasciatus TaxID=7176 RepID=B0X787_CULQU|nr:conserved hypothetical protein [Culex quinquefasciatus]|eukprot:XP_001865509.1 conserved hypothetical protein [Culex quinquefasciatus]
MTSITSGPSGLMPHIETPPEFERAEQDAGSIASSEQQHDFDHFRAFGADAAHRDATFADSAVASSIIDKPLVYQGCKIPIYLDNNATEVRVLDLPLGISNDDVVKVMSKYGEILTIANDRWINFFPGIPNGVRTLRMLLKQPTPKSITVNNAAAHIRCTSSSFLLIYIAKSGRLVLVAVRVLGTDPEQFSPPVASIVLCPKGVADRRDVSSTRVGFVATALNSVDCGSRVSTRSRLQEVLHSALYSWCCLRGRDDTAATKIAEGGEASWRRGRPNLEGFNVVRDGEMFWQGSCQPSATAK